MPLFARAIKLLTGETDPTEAKVLLTDDQLLSAGWKRYSQRPGLDESMKRWAREHDFWYKDRPIWFPFGRKRFVIWKREWIRTAPFYRRWTGL